MRVARLAVMASLVVILAASLSPLRAADKPKDLIVGKWKPTKEKDKDSVLDFQKDGKLKITLNAELSIDGSYKFLDDDTMEVELTFKGKTDTIKMKVKVTKDELITTQDKNGKKKEDKFKRIK
jgi:uncharacterized protein (TIGR03066 family)